MPMIQVKHLCGMDLLLHQIFKGQLSGTNHTSIVNVQTNGSMVQRLLFQISSPDTLAGDTLNFLYMLQLPLWKQTLIGLTSINVPLEKEIQDQLTLPVLHAARMQQLNVNQFTALVLGEEDIN